VQIISKNRGPAVLPLWEGVGIRGRRSMGRRGIWRWRRRGGCGCTREKPLSPLATSPGARAAILDCRDQP